MDESIIIGKEVKAHITAHAAMAALGRKVCEVKLFEPIFEQVKIDQKTVKYTPIEKLIDAEIAILAGAHGLVEINKRVRPDRGLQVAFGREDCAEQSVVQDTLDACTLENVAEMQTGLDLIYSQYGQGYQHNCQKEWQLPDVDMTGRPCGKKAAFATKKGYFAKQCNRRGRHKGYLIATHYEEILSKQLFDGKTQLTKALRPLVEAAEKTLDLDQDEEKRQRTILRVDSGGGSVDDIKEDKQGLDTSKRNKKRFPAQFMLSLLEVLAHSILIWTRRWLAPRCSIITQFGLLRLVRDAFRTNGIVIQDQEAHIIKIVFNQADPFARELQAGFAALFAQQHLAIILGET